MGERLSKALGTSQRKMSFPEWLMEILKAVYTGEWGDPGEVTEGLIQHRTPCQALPILHSFNGYVLNVSHVQALLYVQGKQPGVRQARCFPSCGFYSTKSTRLFMAEPSASPALSPPTPHLLNHSKFWLFLPTSTASLLPLPGMCSPTSSPCRSPRSPAKLLLLVQAWPSTCPLRWGWPHLS